MSLFTSSSNIIYPARQLPLTVISLEDWSFISVKGPDSQMYLQGQVTIDVLKICNRHYNLCAHCNFNGKVWSTFLLFHYKNYYAYIQRKSISEIQIQELRKYSIFSKVKIQKEKNFFLLGIAGSNARVFLSQFFVKLPDVNNLVITEKNNLIFLINKPAERFLLVLSKENMDLFKNIMQEKILYNNNQQWLALDIESSFPIIDKISSIKFFPQEINLEKNKAINFYKGCYYGQEIISRIYFKKLNKRALYCLMSKSVINPKIGSIIEIQKEKNWFKIGVLLSFVHIYDSEIWIQAVLNKFLNSNNKFRIHGFKNIFFIKN